MRSIITKGLYPIKNKERKIKNENTEKGKKFFNESTLLDNISLLYVVIIINNNYVRWEEFSSNDTLLTLHELVTSKYNVGKYNFEINNLWLNIEIDHKDKLIDFCTVDNSLTVRIFTNDENYTLDKNIL